MAESTRSPLAIIGAVLVMAILIGGYLYITRDAGCVAPADADLGGSVAQIEGPDGECRYDIIGD